MTPGGNKIEFEVMISEN